MRIRPQALLFLILSTINPLQQLLKNLRDFCFFLSQIKIACHTEPLHKFLKYDQLKKHILHCFFPYTASIPSRLAEMCFQLTITRNVSQNNLSRRIFFKPGSAFRILKVSLCNFYWHSTMNVDDHLESPNPTNQNRSRGTTHSPLTVSIPPPEFRLERPAQFRRRPSQK